MLRNKGNKRIEEIKTDFDIEQLSYDRLLRSFKALKLTSSFREFDKFKLKGYRFQYVFSVLIMMVVLPCKTVSASLSMLSDEGIKMGKDVYYRLKNNENIRWRMVLWHIAMRFVAVTGANDTGESKKPCYLIFDDTTIEKSGKKLEFVGRVWDHVKQRSVLGFKILVMMYWDGKSSIPLDFSVHREKGKNGSKPFGMKKSELGRQYSKKRIKASEGGSRAKELDTSKVEMMLKMFYSAVYRRLHIDYVLVDSWFTCDALIQAVAKEGIKLIGMYKIAAAKFLYRGRELSCSQINSLMVKPVYCKRLKMYYKRAVVMRNGMRLVLFFSRQGKRGKWKVLLTTDLELSYIEMMEHYRVRWTVEVFNKEAKGLLNLGGCRSSCFDAQIADTTISMAAYILLSFRYRYEHYETMGALFRSVNDEWLRMTLDKRLWGLFLEIIGILADVLETDADDLLEKILRDTRAEQLLLPMMDDRLKASG